MKTRTAVVVALSVVVVFVAARVGRADRDSDQQLNQEDAQIREHAAAMVSDGRNIFRFDTFGDEAFWGGALRLHETIAGTANGGTGPGLSPRAALALGLKVDSAMLPQDLVNAVTQGN